jgi:hypothetical protein
MMLNILVSFTPKLFYRLIEPPTFPTIAGITNPIKVNPNGPSCDIPEDPNILSVFVLTSCD